MPELVACPSCGCKIQMAQTHLGSRTLCVACGKDFVAQGPPERGPVPLCPACQGPADWDAAACPHCGQPFDPADAPRRWPTRRDGEAHRGPLIDNLGALSLLCGMVGFCTGGLGAAVALAAGLAAVVMADRDLAAMRRGDLDPAGRAATERGRAKAVVGLVLAVVFGSLVVLVIIQALRL